MNLVSLLVCCACVAPAGVRAQARARGLDLVYTWEAATPREQATADTTVVPASRGAIFVPAMTRPTLEPLVVVVDRDRRSATGRPGQRIIVEPGRYSVVVGSTQTGGKTTVSVDVQAGNTVIPPVTWGGLQVEVVDGKGKPLREGYELYSLNRGTSCGLGFGADTSQGEELRTWLLVPGVYRIVPPGGRMSDFGEAVSVTVPASGLVRFRLTMEPGGGVLGGTAVTPEEAAAAAVERSGPWRRTLALGLDGMLSHTSETVGVPDQIFVAGGAVVQGRLAYRGGWNLFAVDLEAEGGLAFIGAADGERLPLLKTKDRGRLQLLYALLLGEWVGPYVRGFANTRFFPTETFYPGGATLRVRWLDGTSSVETVQPGGTFRTSGAGGPTALQAGAGVALNLLKLQHVTLDLRAGFADRYSIFNGTLARIGGSAGDDDYVELADFNQIGLEGTVELTARLTGWLAYITGVEYFGEFEALDRPVLEWRNALSVRLSRYFSLNYNINLLRQPDVVDTTQLQQGVQLRAMFNVL